MTTKKEAVIQAEEYLVQIQQKLEQQDLARYKVAENRYSQLRDVIELIGVPDIFASLEPNIPTVGCVYTPGKNYLILGKNSLVQLLENQDSQNKLTDDIADFLNNKKKFDKIGLGIGIELNTSSVICEDGEKLHITRYLLLSVFGKEVLIQNVFTDDDGMTLFLDRDSNPSEEKFRKPTSRNNLLQRITGNDPISDIQTKFISRIPSHFFKK